MNDFISRAALIDALDLTDWYHIHGGKLIPGAENQSEALYKADDVFRVVEDLPAERTEERTETHACDLISQEVNRMDDYISRQALLKDIENYHVSDGKFQHWVEVQPSAPVREVVRGRWISERCSACGEWAPSDGYGWIRETKYCPNCGACMDMREDGE